MEKKTPPTHKRAAAFALSRMILASLEAEDPTVDIRQLIINWSLLDAFRTQDRKTVLPQSDIRAASTPTEPPSAGRAPRRRSGIRNAGPACTCTYGCSS